MPTISSAGSMTRPWLALPAACVHANFEHKSLLWTALWLGEGPGALAHRQFFRP